MRTVLMPRSVRRKVSITRIQKVASPNADRPCGAPLLFGCLFSRSYDMNAIHTPDRHFSLIVAEMFIFARPAFGPGKIFEEDAKISRFDEAPTMPALQ